MKKIIIGVAGLSLVCMASTAFGQIDDSKLDAASLLKMEQSLAVDALMGMDKKSRVAMLKSMNPKERNGLWFQVKRAEVAAKRGKEAQSGLKAYMPDTRIIYDPPLEHPNLRAPGTPGTIRYDDGLYSVGFGGSNLVGNKFDGHADGPMGNPGTVTSVEVVVVPGPANTTSSAGFVLLGPQTTMGGAMAIFSTFAVASGIIDVVNFTGLNVTYTGDSYYVLFGDFNSVYIPVFGTGTTQGQGHHGVVGITGGMGPNITATSNLGGTLNASISTSGNILPVELMQFEIE